MSASPLSRLLARVGADESAVDRLEQIREHFTIDAETDAWLIPLCEALLAESIAVPAVCFARVGTHASSYLVEVAGLLEWDYEDYGEGALLRLPGRQRAAVISREAMSATGEACCSFAIHTERPAVAAPWGHGQLWHGAQTTAEEHERRLRTGTTSGGSAAPAPRYSSRFASDRGTIAAAATAEAELWRQVAAHPGMLLTLVDLSFEMFAAGYYYIIDEHNRLEERHAKKVIAVYRRFADHFKLLTIYPTP